MVNDALEITLFGAVSKKIKKDEKRS